MTRPYARAAALLRELAEVFEAFGESDCKTPRRHLMRAATLFEETAGVFREWANMALPEPIDPPSTAGVYCALGADGCLKIGKARDISSRLAEGQCWQADVLKLLAVLSDDPADEGAFHRRFRRYWVRGEWFRPGHDLVAFIHERRAE